MSRNVSFFLDGEEVQALPGETIWQVAQRHGQTIPHLCLSTQIDYRPSGNCRACVVEIEGERVLAASCSRTPVQGMRVSSVSSERAVQARKTVLELLVADQPQRASAPDPNSDLWRWAQKLGVQESRFPPGKKRTADYSHPAIAVNMDACITCQLCVQACRDIQVNQVIGLSGRGADTEIIFDFADAMGQSTCVGCGECVQLCPTGALMPAAALDDAGLSLIKPDEQLDDPVRSVCPYCGVGCQIDYRVKDGRILYVQGAGGEANRNRLCIKGRFGFDYVSHAQRLTQPLIRKPGVAKNALVEFDPANPWTHFRPASWDEALEVAAQGLSKVRDERGSEALAGFGSAKCSNEEAYLFQKLVRTGFGTNNVDHCTRLCHASSVAALLEGVGSGAVSASFMEVENAEVAILIGCNPESNHPVAATFFKRAAQQGTRLIVMDPRGLNLKKHATHMLQLKPGADVSLINAMMHVILEENLYKADFVNQRVLGFAQLKEHLRSFSPQAMQEICGIEAATIREVARLYATAKSAMIFWGMGISQHVHGTDNARCLISLALMTGQIGRPGTGLHPLRGQNNVQGASDAGLIPMMYPDYQRVDSADITAHFAQLWNTRLNPEPGLTVVEIMDAIRQGQISGMYIMGENPAMSDPDASHARAALAALDHLVVQDLFLTETAIYADVILPAAAWPEKNGTVTNTNRQVQMGRAVIPMPGDVRPDWWIIQEIARGMGLDWQYSGPEAVFAEMGQVMASLANISWQRLQRENSVMYPCAGPDMPGQDVVFGESFPTETGRASMVPAAIVPPDERPDNDYPLILSTGRILEHWHTGSMTRRSSVLDQLEPEAIVTMNRQDMRHYGIEPGDRVRILTRRAAIQARVRLDMAIANGMIFMPFCFSEGAANMLTNPKLDPVGKIPEFKFCAAQLEKLAQADGQ